MILSLKWRTTHILLGGVSLMILSFFSTPASWGILAKVVIESIIFPASKTVGCGRTIPWVPFMTFYDYTHGSTSPVTEGFSECWTRQQRIQETPMYFCFRKERCVEFHQILWTVSFGPCVFLQEFSIIRFLDIERYGNPNFSGGFVKACCLISVVENSSGSHPSSLAIFWWLLMSMRAK